MQEKLRQFVRLGEPDRVKKSIPTKCVFKCKKDDHGVIIRNIAHLVVQGFNQQEGMDYIDVYALVVRLEAIRIFLAYASFKIFKVYEMDVKSEFLDGELHEEVYVKQPSDYLERFYHLNKVLNGLQ